MPSTVMTRKPLFILLPVLLALNICSADEGFWVAGTQGIYRGTIDAKTGKLGDVTLISTAKGPNFLALSPDHSYLYATLAQSVEAFELKAHNALNPLNERPTGGAGACHVSLDATGHDLFAANYDGGSIACLKIKDDGSLGEQTALIPFTGTGPDPKRQTKPYAHSIYADPDNKFVYACDLGTDSIWIFQFDADKGTLTPATPPVAKAPPGSGPRHLAFSPNGKYVFSSNEMGHSVTSFSRNAATGELTTIGTVSSLTPDVPDEGVTTAEIACHPSGKWVYVSNRGCDTISVLAVGDDGKLTFVQEISAGVKFPRSFALDANGNWLVAAGQKSNEIDVLQIDPATGKLSPTYQTAPVPGAICVLFPGKLADSTPAHTQDSHSSDSHPPTDTHTPDKDVQ